MYKSPGTENIKGHQKIKTGPSWEQPSGEGKSAGGTANLKANAKIMTGADRSSPKGSDEHCLSTDHFSDHKV